MLRCTAARLAMGSASQDPDLQGSTPAGQQASGSSKFGPYMPRQYGIPGMADQQHLDHHRLTQGTTHTV